MKLLRAVIFGAVALLGATCAASSYNDENAVSGNTVINDDLGLDADASGEDDLDTDMAGESMKSILELQIKWGPDRRVSVVLSRGLVSEPPAIAMTEVITTLGSGVISEKIVQLTKGTKVQAVAVNAFAIATNKKTWTFSTRDRAQREEWMTALIHAMEETGHMAAVPYDGDAFDDKKRAPYPSDVLDLKIPYHGMQPRKVTLAGSALSACKLANGGTATKICERIILDSSSDAVPVANKQGGWGRARFLFKVTTADSSDSDNSWTLDAGSPDAQARWVALIKGAVRDAKSDVGDHTHARQDKSFGQARVLQLTAGRTVNSGAISTSKSLAFSTRDRAQSDGRRAALVYDMEQRGHTAASSDEADAVSHDSSATEADNRFDAGSPEQQARWIALYEDAVRKATGYDDTDDTEDEIVQLTEETQVQPVAVEGFAVSTSEESLAYSARDRAELDVRMTVLDDSMEETGETAAATSDEADAVSDEAPAAEADNVRVAALVHAIEQRGHTAATSDGADVVPDDASAIEADNIVQLTEGPQIPPVAVDGIAVSTSKEGLAFSTRDRAELDVRMTVLDHSMEETGETAAATSDEADAVSDEAPAAEADNVRMAALVHAIEQRGHTAATPDGADVDVVPDGASAIEAENPSGVLDLMIPYGGMRRRQVTLAGSALSACVLNRDGTASKSCEEITLDGNSDVVPVTLKKGRRGKGYALFRVTTGSSSKSWMFDAGNPEEQSKWVTLIEGAISEAKGDDDDTDEEDKAKVTIVWGCRGSKLGPKDRPLEPGTFLCNLNKNRPTALEVTETGDVLLSAGIYPDRAQDPLWAHRSTGASGISALGCSLEAFWQRVRSKEEIQVNLSVKNGRWRVGRGKMCTFERSPAPEGSLRRFLPWDERGREITGAELHLMQDGDAMILSEKMSVFWDRLRHPTREIVQE